MTPISIGLIGAGVIGRAHAAILAKLLSEQARFAAITDPSNAGNALAASLGQQHFAGAAAMLDAVRTDAAIVATPNVLHRLNAHDCIDRGVAVLVEKPAAENFAAARDIPEHAERKGVPLLVGHFRRHNPVLLAARHDPGRQARPPRRDRRVLNSAGTGCVLQRRVVT
jgi:predicted dehydrogenase